MQKVRVKRDELLAKIRKNRDEHRDLFLKAQEGFRARAVEELDKMLALARDGKEVRLYVGLEQPEDHTAEYDRAIEMLEMSQDDTLDVDRQTFAQLVKNEWAWFEKAMVTNTLYASGGKSGGSY